MTLPSDSDLAKAIGLGIYDSCLDDLASAIHRRRTAAAAIKAGELQIGDSFKIGKITPKALEGAMVEVVGFKGNVIECVLLETVYSVGRRGTYGVGRQVNIPTACVGEVL